MSGRWPGVGGDGGACLLWSLITWWGWNVGGFYFWRLLLLWGVALQSGRLMSLLMLGILVCCMGVGFNGFGI